MNSEKKNNFVVQAGILAAAGILVRIIGILYRSPLTGIIGDEGNGYYTSAYNIYTIILLISSYSIPSAISKVIAQYLAVKEYNNAHKIFHCALIYVTIVGGAASLFAFFAAHLLVTDNCVMVLRVFAPTIFLSGFLGVLRGYFQAHRTMVPTSISQILEQIANAIISIGMAYVLIHTIAGSDQTSRAVHGAIGSALGTGSGVLVGLIFMFCVYTKNKRDILGKVHADTDHREMDYGEIFKVLITMVTPFILSTFIYNFSTSLNQTIYSRVCMGFFGMAESDVATNYGIFAGKAVVISNIPIAIASAMSSAMIPNISGSFAQKDMEKCRSQVNTAVKTTMLISIPCAVGLFVLAQPVTCLLFPQKASLATASALLRAIAIAVVFYALSTLTNAVLQGIGRVNVPVINAAIALVIQTVVLLACLFGTGLGLYSLAVAMVTYSLCMCFLNQMAVRKSLQYRQEFRKTFILPAISAVIMGVIAFLSYQGVYMVVSSNVIALCVSIMLAVIVYFLVLIFIKGITAEDLQAIPKGGALLRVFRKLHFPI